MKAKLYFSVILFFIISLQTYAQQKLTLQDLTIFYKFYPHSVDGFRSMNDGEHYTLIEDKKSLVKFDYKTGEPVDTLFSIEDLDIKALSGYEFSKDESKILFHGPKKMIYRHSFYANYYIWDFNKKELIEISPGKMIELAKMSPNAEKVAFVDDNNIYIKDLETHEITAITKDGEKNKIINGRPDWVYEEEFEFVDGYYWSPDGEKIAYLKFDESQVKEYMIKIYKGKYPTFEENTPYPEFRTWKYPKAGEDNSVVSVHIYHLNNQQTIKVDVGQEKDQYIPRIRWTKDPEKLAVFRLNRRQDYLEILLADTKNGNTEIIYDEKNEQYIDETTFDSYTFLSDGENMAFASEMDGWLKIYVYNYKNDELRKVTKGDWDVIDYLGYDENREVFYYTAAKNTPIETDLYKINFNGRKEKKLSTQTGSNSAEFDKNFNYYINTYSDHDTPSYITLHNHKGKQIRILEENKQIQKQLKAVNMPKKEFFSFTTSDNVELHGWMIKPNNFDQNKKYPVIVYQYNGPNSQTVQNKFNIDWNYYLAQEGYISVAVDCRGTGARGEAFRKSTYLQLGKYETIDMIETAKYLGKLNYIDKDRIAVWGWSYGGFITALCLTKGADYYKAGVAVAPVTNWRFYDNIYTERFMRKPQENPDGYDNNSPINFAGQMEGKILLLHGGADDNVHPQNTMEFAEMLIQNNKDFQMHMYTNRNHGIYGGYTRYDLYRRMTRFIKNNL